MARTRPSAKASSARRVNHDELAAFACPNEDCRDFNRFGAGNLSVCELMGKQRIRRLYCHTCGQRFSERQGSLREQSKLPEETVVRIVKCLGHGCSIEATADICEVDPRTVELLLTKAGRRAEVFHQQQLAQLTQPLDVVELDELQCAIAGTKKGDVLSQLASLVGRTDPGFMSPWR